MIQHTHLCRIPLVSRLAIDEHIPIPSEQGTHGLDEARNHRFKYGLV